MVSAYTFALACRLAGLEQKDASRLGCASVLGICFGKNRLVDRLKSAPSTRHKIPSSYPGVTDFGVFSSTSHKSKSNG